MSPRPKNIRKVNNMPPVAGFKPIASNICRKDAIFLHFEEYEAIRLCDYEMKTQQAFLRSAAIRSPSGSTSCRRWRCPQSQSRWAMQQNGRSQPGSCRRSG